MNNFTRINNINISDITITDGAYRCLCLIEQHCYGDKTDCFISIKYMAVALGRSCRTIIRYIKELVKAGLIIKRKRGSLCNKYITLQKKVMLMAEKAKANQDNNSDSPDKPTEGQDSHKNNSKGNYLNKNKNSKNKGNKANPPYKKKEDSWKYEGRGAAYYIDAFNKILNGS
ncbi:helix-turn-helix domain-containing protein [Clostridium niameyense]|uniref:Helix-turn-helix domain-containing protein n=1 Tax=Clostridium niameyense TaxID=1622073 RepID=A0A6M0RC14_9CLOT|nr:helix-turn-helix domain-containing protein [Clostridium niameyense]NEZ47841.1 helix-turn-helix domain-containing protein [Clostridium niameyense]